MNYLFKTTSKFGHLILLMAVGFFAIRSFLLGGFIPTHDGEYHIIRLWQFDKVFMSGVLFPRWAPDLNDGYGVPIFSFFYPLPNYVGELFHLFGFSLIDSVQLTLASGLFVSAFAFYVWMRCFFGKWQSVVGSIFYLLAPYHLVDVFVRGSVGEVWALALIPLVLLFTTRVIRSDEANRVDYLVLPVSAALLLMSHNIIGVLFYVIGFLYGIVLLCIFKKARPQILLKNYLYGLLLTAFFWIPIIFESKYIVGLQIVNVFDHFVALFQLLIPMWGTGFSVPGVTDEISFQIGIPHVLVIVTAVFINIKKQDKLVWWLLFVFTVAVLLILEISAPIWRLFPFLVYFQYPWRILSLVILVSSFFAAYCAQFKPVVSIPLLLLLALVFYLPYTNAVVYEKRDDQWYLTSPNWTEGTATLGNSFNTIWFTSGFARLDKKASIIAGEGEILERFFKPTSYSLRINAKTPLRLALHSAYFPGWNAKIDGEKLQVAEQNGIIMLTIPTGEHSITSSFSNTTVRKLSDMISLIFLLYGVYILGNFNR